jgi:hypothetical protein
MLHASVTSPGFKTRRQMVSDSRDARGEAPKTRWVTVGDLNAPVAGTDVLS